MLHPHTAHNSHQARRQTKTKPRTAAEQSTHTNTQRGTHTHAVRSSAAQFQVHTHYPRTHIHTANTAHTHTLATRNRQTKFSCKLPEEDTRKQPKREQKRQQINKVKHTHTNRHTRANTNTHSGTHRQTDRHSKSDIETVFVAGAQLLRGLQQPKREREEGGGEECGVGGRSAAGVC